MWILRPSKHQAIRFEMTLQILVDASETYERCVHVVHFPVSKFSDKALDVQKVVIRKYLQIYLAEWLDTVFPNIVAEV